MADYTIIFEKLKEATIENPVSPAEATLAELDEIAQMTRVVLEITQPTPMSYTTT